MSTVLDKIHVPHYNVHHYKLTPIKIHCNPVHLFIDKCYNIIEWGTVCITERNSASVLFIRMKPFKFIM